MAATKRMSNGDAKAAAVPPEMTSTAHSTRPAAASLANSVPAPFQGPHPSTIRVSAPYLTQAAIDHRLLLSTVSSAASNSLGLSAADAHERSLAEAREDSVRLQGVTWLDSVRRALQLPVRTFTTACVYYHKFRLAHPTVDYNWVDAAVASLLTSCKNEDTLKKSRDILAAAHNLKLPTAQEHLGADNPVFDQPSRTAIGLERLVLESGAFDFRSRSPHHLLVKIAKSLAGKLPAVGDAEHRAAAELAWTILTDLHRTFAPLKQTSATLALASFELALLLNSDALDPGKGLAPEASQALSGHRWHTTRPEVMETLLDALDLYTHHTAATIIGPRCTLEQFLQIRLILNKECSSAGIARYTVSQPTSSEPSNGGGATLRVSNGHPTPVSPPQPDQLPQQVIAPALTYPPQEGGGTLRFVLNPQRAVDEKLEVNRYHVEEWEEYEEEIEIPLPRSRSHDRDASRRSGGDDRRGARHDRDREVERDRHHYRERDRDRRYDDRHYDDRERDRRYDSRSDRERRYYEESYRRRDRDERR